MKRIIIFHGADYHAQIVLPTELDAFIEFGRLNANNLDRNVSYKLTY